MTSPITSEASQFSHTTFLEPAICRQRQGISPPRLDLRPIWRDGDPQEHIKVSPVDPSPFGGDSFGGHSYSSSFLRSSASLHPNHQSLPPPLTEPPSPRRYLGLSSMPSYPEPSQYYLTSTDPHTSSGSPTFPLRPSDDWSLPRAPSLSSSQDSFWGQNPNVLSELPGLTHRRSFSTISSDAVATPAREIDSHISPGSSEPPWDRQSIELPSPHRGQHDPSPTSRAPIAPWTNENGDGASRARQPIYTARMRTSQACEKCRSRKAKCDGKSPCERCAIRGLTCEYSRDRRVRGAGKRPRPGKNCHREENSFYALG